MQLHLKTHSNCCKKLKQKVMIVYPLVTSIFELYARCQEIGKISVITEIIVGRYF